MLSDSMVVEYHKLWMSFVRMVGVLLKIIRHGKNHGSEAIATAELDHPIEQLLGGMHMHRCLESGPTAVDGFLEISRFGLEVGDDLPHDTFYFDGGDGIEDVDQTEDIRWRGGLLVVIHPSILSVIGIPSTVR